MSVADGTAVDAVFDREEFFLPLLDRRNVDTIQGTAVFFGDDHILRNVDKAACQVSGVRSFKRGIRKTFTRTVRRDEVFKNT